MYPFSQARDYRELPEPQFYKRIQCEPAADAHAQKNGGVRDFSVRAVAINLENWVETDLHQFYSLVVHFPPIVIERYVKDPRVRVGDKVSAIP